MLIEYWQLPKIMQNDEVGYYYNSLKEKSTAILIKRILDIIFSLLFIVLFLPLMIIISALIKMDSKGEVIFKQIRVTQYMRPFVILKFRTMYCGIQGSEITSSSDNRITKIGNFLRKTRLDELPQLFNILKGDMSFVGVRPEVPIFVLGYTKDMIATLLLPAGLTSITSLEFKDEQEMITGNNYEREYMEIILPEKMKINLNYIYNFSVGVDLKIIIKTAILGLESLFSGK